MTMTSMRKALAAIRHRLTQAASLRSFAFTLALFSILAWAGRTPAQNDGLNEYQLKAAFLLNFAKFVDWPTDIYPNPQGPFYICVLGNDPFGQILEDSLAGKSLGTHPVSLRRAKDVSGIRGCQIVFVSASSSSKYTELAQIVRGARILLVGENEGFASSGGAIEFVLEGNHVRFAINPEAAQRAGLTVSSKLLMLARIVHDSTALSAGKS